MTIEKILDINAIRSLMTKYSVTYEEVIKLVEEKTLQYCSAHYNDTGIKIKLYKNKDKLNPYIVLSNGTKIKTKDIDLRVIADTQQSIMQYLDNCMKLKNFSKIESMINSIVQVDIKLVKKHYIVLSFLENIYTISRDSFIPNEHIALNSRMYMYLHSVEKTETNYINIGLTRNNNEFIEELLKLFIPEISNYSIVIKSINRVPMFCTVVMIDCKRTRNSRPINACLGVKAERKRSIDVALGVERVIFVRSSQTTEEIIRAVIKISRADIVIEKEGETYYINIYNYIKYISINHYENLLGQIFPENTFVVQKKTIVTDHILDGVCNEVKAERIYNMLPNISDLMHARCSTLMTEIELTRDEVLTLFRRVIDIFYNFEEYNFDTEDSIFEQDLSIRTYYQNIKNKG